MPPKGTPPIFWGLTFDSYHTLYYTVVGKTHMYMLVGVSVKCGCV